MEASPSYSNTRNPPPTRSASDLGSASASIQNLSSILNNPSPSTYYYSPWSLWPSTASSAGDLASAPPITISSPLPDVPRSDFAPYLALIFEPYSRFEDIINHSLNETTNLEDSARGGDQGEALVACLREVPSLFFKEDFALEDGATFKSVCPFSPSEDENLALQERLTQYLDTVEMHLVREIALRSDSFFEAQGQLQGLDGEIVEACVRIRELKAGIRVLTGDLVGSAKQVQDLNAARGNLVGLQRKLTVILYVSQALSALKLLVAAADCAGALDVIDDLQHLLDTDELAGLHCFRHLRDQLATSLDSINSILSAEFVSAAIHDARAVDSAIVPKIKTNAPNSINGLEENFNDDESSNLRDRLLPLIVCLLRTAKLPAVLRIYRETLITEMKATIKSTVAELLPILLPRPLESDLVTGERAVNSDGGGLSLASKLRSLSSESFVQLLIAIFKVVQAHLLQAAEVKRVIEWIMGNVNGCYALDSVAVAGEQGSAIPAAGEDSDNQVLSHLPNSLPRNTPKFSLFQGRINESSSPSASKNFLADVLRENTEAVFAACDAAHGRWAKLLGVRALLHPKLRLHEFLSIYIITQDFIATTERVGGRLGYSIRGTLQSQAKAFVDFQHESRISKLKAVLDQETWVSVDVPDEFQAILSSLSSSEAPFGSSEFVTSNPSLQMAAPDCSVGQPVSMNEMVEGPAGHAQGISSMHLAGLNQENKVESVSIRIADGSLNEYARASSQTIVYGGVGYHMVNCGLILLRMLAEYVDISKCLPALSSEVVHRVAEILKLFNTRTCQLVLGAGAMQFSSAILRDFGHSFTANYIRDLAIENHDVSGLKSITSKHLALASQIISFIYAIIPEIRRVLFLKIPEARKVLLLSELERVAQDYKVHRDEIHTKLIQIMRERLLANLRKLPQIVETWNAPEDNDLQPSQFARHVTKEVTYLHRILSQILLEADVHAIFRQVVQIFHSHISEAFSKLDVNTTQARNRLRRDVQHILECIRKLPSDNSSKNDVPNYGLLDEFLAERFAPEEAH